MTIMSIMNANGRQLAKTPSEYAYSILPCARASFTIILQIL